VAIDSIELETENRLLTDIREFDRVLGGGLVPGTLVLIGGDPGIGKSTLMLQALYGLANQGHKVLYVSGEESNRQIRLRSQRLDTVASELMVVSEVEIDAILGMIQAAPPQVLVIDSIQTMYNAELTSAPGSVSQVRESTVRLMMMAKKTGIPTLLVGHVTKDGAIAGPKLLEHMVDTVLYFEGDRNHIFRILRAVKNRFGSTNEIGVFEMKDQGLDEVANPSAVFLSERPANAPGSAVTASMDHRLFFYLSGLRMHRAQQLPPVWKVRGRFWLNCRLWSAAPALARPGEPFWGWIPIGSPCWQRLWKNNSACT
jgi:DNA repair protein RadA/Sms